MDKNTLIKELENRGYNRDAAVTQPQLYSVIQRKQLFSQTNRLNAGWGRGKIVVAEINNDEDLNKPIEQLISKWKDLVGRYKDQFLCLEENPDEWKFYDSNGSQIKYEQLFPKSLPLTEPLQQIYYGAPGTGKSHKIKEQEKGFAKVFRTTFHPDSDYSTFVGCYKPTMEEGAVYGPQGPLKDGKGAEIKENKIVYSFVAQAFTKAYIEAWKKYGSEDENKEVLLVIEEINRGNCAQIFGDLFQLLDRNDYGFSDYPIDADHDLQKYIAENGELAVSEVYDCNGKDISEEINSGEKLMLPPNLYIWATMNTSDQSLFPIDSAFKRRWDWKYIPINTKKENWSIKVGNDFYRWSDFLKKINDKILSLTNSEDKQLGFYFCKANDNVIAAEKFVNKVLFYVYNDVYKDYDFEDGMFKDGENDKLTFRKYFDYDGNIVNENVKKFLDNLGVEKDSNIDEAPEAPEDVEDENKVSTPSSKKDYTKFSVNGAGSYGKNNLATECVKEYIKLNPTKTADDVIKDWLDFDNIVPHFIESKEQYEARTDNSKRSNEIKCGDSVLYVAHDGYGSNGKVYNLMEAVNKKDWGIKIEKVIP